MRCLVDGYWEWRSAVYRSAAASLARRIVEARTKTERSGQTRRGAPSLREGRNEPR